MDRRVIMKMIPSLSVVIRALQSFFHQLCARPSIPCLLPWLYRVKQMASNKTILVALRKRTVFQIFKCEFLTKQRKQLQLLKICQIEEWSSTRIRLAWICRACKLLLSPHSSMCRLSRQNLVITYPFQLLKRISQVVLEILWRKSGLTLSLWWVHHHQPWNKQTDLEKVEKTTDQLIRMSGAFNL